MSAEALLPLILFAVVSTLTPGAATTLATAQGAHFGFRRSVPAMAGNALGLASVAAAAAAGLAGLLLAAPALQLAMKAAGSAYLLWLAWRIGRSGSPRLRGDLARPMGLLSGIWMLWYNPKGWAMSMGAAASFAALADGPASLALLLGLTFGLAVGMSLCLWCLTGQALARLLRSEAQWRIFNGMLALLLAASIAPMWLD